MYEQTHEQKKYVEKAIIWTLRELRMQIIPMINSLLIKNKIYCINILFYLFLFL